MADCDEITGMVDVVVAGGGPSGWAIAAACADVGLHTVLVDPRPRVPWRATYGLWRDELPSLPGSAIAAAPESITAYGTKPHELDRQYLVLDNAGLRAHLSHFGVEVRAGEVVGAEHGSRGSTVALADGSRIATGVVVDCSGARRVLSGGPPHGDRAEQTASGLVLDAGEARRLVPGAVFMDWRGATGPGPSFLYAIPIGGDRMLVEETSLAAKPGVPLRVLESRLHARLAAAGVHPSGSVERVRIPLDIPPPLPGRAVPFGIAAGLVHPATGYSVATSLALAPAVAAAISGGLREGPAAAARAARREIWPPTALAVYTLRRRGLRALRGMPPGELGRFFDLFFALPESRRRAFLSDRTDLPGNSSAMSEIFRSAPWRLRSRLIR